MQLRRPPASLDQIKAKIVRLSNYSALHWPEKLAVELQLANGRSLQCHITAIGGHQERAAIKVKDIQTRQETLVFADEVVYVRADV